MEKTVQSFADSKHWDVWEGPEIEGSFDREEMTLFVRNNFDPMRMVDDLELLRKYSRVWFCAEFIDKEVINWVAENEDVKVCYELGHLFRREEISKKVRVYGKVNLGLIEGDQICVGKPYQDESFVIGEGVKVSVADYERDVRIK